MVNQIVKGTQLVLDQTILDIGDIGILLDGNGDPTGQIRLGVGDQLGGYTINGAVGSGAVATVNGQTGVVSLSLGDILGVSVGDGASLDQVLKWNGAAWAPSSSAGAFAKLSDILLTGLLDGQSIRWNAIAQKFVNYTAATAGGDNLGNHTATQDLNLAGFALMSAGSLRFTNNWRLRDTGINTFVVERFNSGIPAALLVLQHTGAPGLGYLTLTDYGSARPDDSGTASLNNLAYFQTNGILRKANYSSNANAFKAIPADAFGKLSGLSGAQVGNVLAYDGANFIPQTPAGGGGVTTFLALTDTPLLADYSGQGSKFVRVNPAATALEFFTLTQSVSNLSEVSAQSPHAENEVIVFSGGTFTVGKQTILGSSDIQLGIPGPGQGLVWNGGLARFDFTNCLITDFGAGTPTTGSIMYFNGTAWVLLVPGTNGHRLTLSNGLPIWAP